MIATRHSHLFNCIIKRQEATHVQKERHVPKKLDKILPTSEKTDPMLTHEENDLKRA